MQSERMTRNELRAGLSAIFGLRMLGLFFILPVFAVHAPRYQGGGDLLLVGIALGAYGLTQAILPSLVSRIAPARARGTAIGVYNTAQTLGLFFGGLGGGWIAGRHGSGPLFGACAALTLAWLAVAAVSVNPKRA